MKTCLRSSALPVESSMDRSCRRLCFRPAGLVIGFISAVLTVAVTPQMSYAATATGSFASGDPTSVVPTIPQPGGTQQTSFTLYNGGTYHFVAYPFTVDTTGIYSATASTPVSENTTFFLTGLFSPGTPPSTPIGNFFAGVYSGSIKSGGVFLDNFSNLSLVAGQQYTALVAYNVGALAGEVSTVTLTGPGCIAIGSNTCAVSTPTLSEWALAMFAAGLALTAWASIRRMQRI